MAGRLSPSLAGVVVVAVVVLGGCGHKPAAVAVANAVPADSFADFVASLPRCAEGQQAASVEEALRREWSEAECLVIEGELSIDAAAGVCGSSSAPSTTSCDAPWFLVGTPAPPAPRQRLPGVARHRRDEHTLPLGNHQNYVHGAPCPHHFIRHCDEDDAGQPRMPGGLSFHLPAIFRAPGRTAGAGDIPTVRVAILGSLHNSCSPYFRSEWNYRVDGACSRPPPRDNALTSEGFDLSRICRLD